MLGVCYLIHFSKPYRHAYHYIGWCHRGKLKDRLACHRQGNGSNLLKHVTSEGIDINIVRVWRNKDRHFERKLKNRGSAKRICPICRGVHND